VLRYAPLSPIWNSSSYTIIWFHSITAATVVFCRKNINQASTTLFQFYTTENCALANYKLWTKLSYNTGQIVGKDHFCTGFVIDTTPRTERMGDMFLKVEMFLTRHSWQRVFTVATLWRTQRYGGRDKSQPSVWRTRACVHQLKTE